MSTSWREEPHDGGTLEEVSAAWQRHMTEEAIHHSLKFIRLQIKNKGHHTYYTEYVDLLIRRCDELGIEVEDLKLHHIKARLGFV